jgi:serine/threonine protein kinase/Tol biopolymer transport system component
MALAAGSRVGVYEVISRIGEGGMGQVFRARDTRLNRDVALKVLPDAFAGDPDRLARFAREAQTLASLNHSNIAHIHGLEESGGVSALVMELVEGDDLSQRIARGPIPVDEALSIAIHVAHALEAAHEQGIIHRDLKPANIKIRDDGAVKVLDFGLAKALEPASASRGGRSHPLESPTITSPAMMTAPGIMLGTAAYMSPEQARGKVVDRRADIWAFGVVLYEMLTGRSMFVADTVGDTVAAVLTREPPLDALPADTPPSVRRVLHRCLQKDATRRYHHIADARIDLEQTVAEPLAAATAHAPTRRFGSVGTAAIAATSVALTALLGWMALAGPSQPRRRYSFTIPNAGFNTVSFTAISPDGQSIAYSPNRHAAPFRLFVRALDAFDEREVASARGTGFNPFFSADGRWLAYFDTGTLYRVSLTSGSAERLGTIPPGSPTGTWGDDGTIVVSAPFRIDNVQKIALARLLPGGTLAALTNPGPGEDHQQPDILPGSKTVLFTLATAKVASVAAVPLSGGEPRIILGDARRPKYAASGHLIFQRPSSGDLMSVRFDPSKLAISGEPTRIAAAAYLIGAAAFDVSREGTIIFSGPTDATGETGFTAVMVNRSGGEATVVAEQGSGSWAEPRISPDGRSLVVRSVASPNCDLWSVDLQRGTTTRVTFEGDNHNAIWRSDGQLTWGADVDGRRGIRMGRADRPGRPTALAEAGYERVPESWSSDRTRLAFTESHPVTGQDIWLLSVDSGEARPFANSPFKEDQARFSPDGKWLAYVSNESGRDEVYVQPADADGARVQISVDGGHSPLWVPGGRELFFVEGASMMSVSLDLRSSRPDVGRPRKLFEGPYVWERIGNFDITPDGTRFVLVRRGAESTPPATLRVLVNSLAQ